MPLHMEGGYCTSGFFVSAAQDAFFLQLLPYRMSVSHAFVYDIVQQMSSNVDSHSSRWNNLEVQ